LTLSVIAGRDPSLVIIAAVLGAFATGVLATLWFVVGAVSETVQAARRMLQ
jgi:hypothetical protein